MSKVALITGITGQDGSYLAEFLLHKGYEVHGIIRRASTFNTGRLGSIYSDPHAAQTRLQLHYGDLTDTTSLIRILEKVKPDEIYNLGAQSHVRVSFDIPDYTGGATGLGVTRLLEAVRAVGINWVKFYQAGSSEMFGKVQETPQTEKTPFYPRSPYGCAKVYAHWVAINYRESYNMFVCNGILFNHESPRRGETFVTRKITRYIADVLRSQTQADLDKVGHLYLGNLQAKRDWGYAPEYVIAMWKMLQKDAPDDYVVATGQTNSIEDFLDASFRYANLDWHNFVKFDERYLRPAEVDLLQGDASKAQRELDWSAHIKCDDLAKIMVDADRNRENSDKLKELWNTA